jgi:hypothetical protein
MTRKSGRRLRVPAQPVDPPRHEQRPLTELDLDRLIAREIVVGLAGIAATEPRLALDERQRPRERILPLTLEPLQAVLDHLEPVERAIVGQAGLWPAPSGEAHPPSEAEWDEVDELFRGA